MSPFDLPGPEFLLFYLAVGAAGLIALKLWRNAAESGEAIRANLSDPYSIAFLRGGRNEMIRVATVSLIDRGLLKVSGSKVSAAEAGTARGVRSSLEQQVLAYFVSPREASSIFSGSTCGASAAQYERDLAQIGAPRWFHENRAHDAPRGRPGCALDHRSRQNRRRALTRPY